MFVYKNDTIVSSEIPSDISRLITPELKNYLIIKDGHIIAKELEDEFKTIVIDDMKNRVSGMESLAKLYPYLNEKEDEVYQENLSRISSGIFIEVPQNLVISEILHIFYVQGQDDLVNNTLLILHKNSELKYFEYVSNQNECNVNFVSNSIVLENATLFYSGISKLNDLAVCNTVRNSYVYRYGKVLFSIAEINDSKIDANINIYLQDKYASGTAQTIAITSKDQKATFHQLIEHNATDTEGYIENYGVSNNNSALVFEGTGKINKYMNRSIARQQNHGIVLGLNSRLDANPFLLIDEYDVEASHGAAIGKIDEEQLYYLMSRGLTYKNAERLIISGFLSPVMKRLSTEALINDFVESVENKTL